MGFLYILDDDNNVVPTDDALIWGRWFEEASRSGRRQVQLTELENGTRISTVFLGTDYNFSGDVPIVFETMVFREDGVSDDLMRYATWDGALAGHDQIVARWRDYFAVIDEFIAEVEGTS